MYRFRFDWRWVALIAIVALIANGGALPWLVLVLVLAGSGVYLLYQGWNVWTGGRPTTSDRVTYWRGQRIETSAPRRVNIPSFRTIGPAVIYLVIGAALTLAALVVVLRQFER